MHHRKILFNSLETQSILQGYWGHCPFCSIICSSHYLSSAFTHTWNASEEDNQKSSSWKTILNNLLVILEFKVLPLASPCNCIEDVVIFCLGFHLSAMLRACSRLMDGGGGCGDLKGGINFHPKHLGGPSKFNWYSVLGGAIKTYFDNQSGLEKFLKE